MKSFEEALAIYVQRREKLDTIPEIMCADVEDGGDVQIGDMTWDHEHASLEITWKLPNKAKKQTIVDLGYEGFGNLIKELMSIAGEP